MSGQTLRFASHGPAGYRLDGFTAGVPVTLISDAITRASLMERRIDVAADDTLTAAHFVAREFPWSDDALIHTDATVTTATLSDPAAAFGLTVTLDATASRLTRTPLAFALYLEFAGAGVVELHAGTILGRSVALPYSTGASLTPSTTPILLTAA